ncbi:MAG TPA: delta-60 repeat domain-containing protein [Pirellulales bacterium]|nr:delta-60 repeat domain-containing protein [Pirellulales bacterium]
MAVTGSGASEKILVGGSTSQPQTTSTTDFALVRYNDDGTLDTSFGVVSGKKHNEVVTSV